MTDKRIELRSEKVRRIIGTIPPALVRWNITVFGSMLHTLSLRGRRKHPAAYTRLLISHFRKERKYQQKYLLL